MPRHSWMTLVLLMDYLWIISSNQHSTINIKEQGTKEIKSCLKNGNTNYVVADNFYGIINASKHFKQNANDTIKEVCDTSSKHCKKTCLEEKKLCKSQKSDSSGISDSIKEICDTSSNVCINISQENRLKELCESLTSEICNDIPFSATCKKIGQHDCIIFLQRNQSKQQKFWKNWPQLEKKDTYLLLYISKKIVNQNVTLHILAGKNSSDTGNEKSNIKYGPVYTKVRCGSQAAYNLSFCEKLHFNDKYTINTTNERAYCINCDNPIKEPEEKIVVNISSDTPLENEDGGVDASAAAQLVTEMKDLISKMNGTSAELSVGKGVEGVIVKQTDPKDMNEVSFAYQTPKEKMKIIDDRRTLEKFSRSFSVSKEAFEKAVSSNISVPFAVVLRILNISQDENNSTVLGDEVLAIDLGAEIKNLTDTININFINVTFTGFTPSCHSWDGNGSKPNWTTEGCETIFNNSLVKCQCSHLTFFAVLLTPLNETISSSDLNNLTIITQVGCGLSVFFLGIILFLYFLIRKVKASTATQILIHLVCALLLLNLTFLVNPFVANLGSPVGCQVMAAVMHFSMLATFSWFAAQGFHLCVQLYRGNIAMRRYVLKIAVISWTLPSIVVITLGSLSKYGEQTIYTDDPQNNVAMCWITDNNVHYIVNIGYYSLVFLFTLSTVIITLSWIFCLKKNKKGSPQENSSGKKVTIIMGLCCQLGVAWGFAFFAYGSFRMLATYIFTILNSFQGFFLFIYYYKTTQVGPGGAKGKGNSESTNSSISTLKTGLESVVNPYVVFEKQKGM